jgi:hypothetical protein
MLESGTRSQRKILPHNKSYVSVPSKSEISLPFFKKFLAGKLSFFRSLHPRHIVNSSPLPRRPADIPCMRILILGGEACQRDLIDKWAKKVSVVM